MAVNAVNSSAGNIIPLSTALARRDKGDKADSADSAGVSSFETEADGSGRDAIDRDAAVAGGHTSAQPPPNVRPDANPVTEQAPDAESIVGVPLYTYQGQLQKIHPGAGQSLSVSA